MLNQYTIDLNSSNRNLIMDIDKTIKNDLIRRSHTIKTIEIEWYFELGYYLIRTNEFISSHYGTDFDSFFKKETTVTKENLLLYLNVAREYVTIHIIQGIIVSWCKCKESCMEEVDNDMYCSNCGKIYDYISPNNNSLCNKGTNNQIANINRSIKEIEGADSIEKELEDDILGEIRRRKISLNNIKHETIFLILKDKKLNKHYKSINSIYNKITNTNPVIVDDETKKILIEDYNKFESIYPLIKDSSRINSINMKFVLYKLFKRHNIPCKGYSVLRTENKHQEHEYLWEEGCKLLSW